MSKEKVKAKVQDIRDRISEADTAGSVEKVRSYVSENPGKAMLMSVGLGFLAGLMLRGDSGEEDDE